MTTLKDYVKAYLLREPRFRQREHKDRGIAQLLMQKWPDLRQIERETLAKVLHDFNSMDRYWRQLLDENSELRGTDYEDKAKLEEEKKEELGYGSKEKSQIL